ncbi:cytochrome P450 71A1-like [Musa acuminata AAA Group]|uniref:cytochrome P450 71A1-like n=1 Tax=Musa acuminata AAA Group TaxID=214697 RepID=UPI0031DD3CF4
MSLLFFLVPFLLLAILLAFKVVLSGKTQLRLPPSPPGLLLLGNLHQLSSLPHRSLLDLSHKHGPVMLIRMGQVPALIVSSADAAQELFKTHDLAISTRPASKAAMKITYGARNISFAPYGERWRQAKKLAVVHLLSLKRVLSLRALRHEEVRRMMERVAAACAGGGRPRGEVDLSEVLYEYANATAYHAAAGKETKEGRTAARYRAVVDDGSVLLGGFQVADAFPALGWLSAITGTDAKLDRIGRRIDEFLSGILQEHIERAEQGFNRNEDFVDVLLSLQRDDAGDLGLAEIDIKAITMDLIAAGTDTSFVSLEWAMAELVRNPRAMKKLQDEVRQVADGKPMVVEEDVNQMTYLKAVIKEVLRLHAPVPILVPRETMSSFSLQGYHVPAKTRVIVNAWAIARDPKSWEAPEEFKPERFMDNAVDYRGNDFLFIPFGAGRRMCPGINFAMATIEIALANLLYHFNWELPDGLNPVDLDMSEAPGLVTPKKIPLRLIAVPKDPLV